MEEQDRGSSDGSDGVPEGSAGEAGELHRGSGAPRVTTFRTPLFEAQHSERYARQTLIRRYEELTGANLIVVIDQIFPANVTLLEELLFNCARDQALHVLLASPGGDGETAIRMVRSCQARTSELTVIVPDMAKSAATLLCLGADKIIMGPGGDLGPVDPQFPIGRGLVGAKDIVAALAEAEERVKNAPDTYPLFSALLADVNMLMVEQARSALDRSGALVREALGCAGRDAARVEELAQGLQSPLIDEPASHSAVISGGTARQFGLPVEDPDLDSEQWQIIWSLWTRYFNMGCFPAGPVAVYEGNRASHVIAPNR